MSRLISPTHIRRYLLEVAAKKRTHKFTRVSAETLVNIEMGVRSHCIRIVETAPSKGVTL